ncbi:hypothetical protein BDY24DRAFT_117325 [Mrakia frigida]|uniref:uncharacterized protein n=1 Tax=Mrakia frigida TaxID=29902 RepID=UPI003FCC0947
MKISSITFLSFSLARVFVGRGGADSAGGASEGGKCRGSLPSPKPSPSLNLQRRVCFSNLCTALTAPSIDLLPLVMSNLVNYRARTGAPPRPITSFPNEVLEMIVKAGIWNNIRDLASLARTCLVFYRVVMPLLVQHVRLVADKEGTTNDAKVSSLFAFLVFPDRNKRAKSLRIIDPTSVLLSHPHGFQLETVLHGFTNVTYFQLPFHLITNHLFDILHQHSSVVNLQLDNFLGDFPSHFRVKRRYEVGARKARLGPITLRNFQSTVARSAQPNKLVSIESFLSYLASFKFTISTFALSFQPLALHTNGNHQVVTTQGPLLPAPHIPRLEKLSVELNDHSQSLGYSWLREVMTRVKSTGGMARLKTLELSIQPSRPDQKGEDVFTLVGKERMPSFDSNQMIVRLAPTASDVVGMEESGVGAPWTGLVFRGLKGVYKRGGDADDQFQLQRLEVKLGAKAVVRPEQMWSLVGDEMMPEVQEVVFEGGRWGGDWLQTSNQFSYLNRLTTLSFTQSLGLTPLQTLSLTLACSPTCFFTLSQTHPDHYAAAKLVGDHTTIFRTLVQISFNRLLALGPSLSIGTSLNLQVESTKVVEDVERKKGGGGPFIGRENGREIKQPGEDGSGRRKIIDLNATRTGTGGWEDWSFGGTIVPSMDDGECFCCGNGISRTVVNAKINVNAGGEEEMKVVGGSVGGAEGTVRKDFVIVEEGKKKKKKAEEEIGPADPIRSLMALGREEVREALRQSGLDLEEFDSRVPDENDPLGFESFLRGTAA